MSTRIALYPGSFDPVTFGHVDLIRRSLSVADQLVISILPNAAKEALLPLAERAALLRAVVASELTDLADRISIRTDADLAVRIAADAGATLIVRGLRAGSDFEAELDRKSTRLNSSHIPLSRMPSSA